MSNKMETQTNSAGKGISSPGFTLVELLVAMVISLVVMGAIYSTYASQQRSYIVQEQVGAMQQNLRVAMYIMVKDIRMAGYDPLIAGGFEIKDIRYYDTSYTLDTNYNMDPDNGFSSFRFTADFDGDGVSDNDETVTYSIYDYPLTSPDGKLDLSRATGSLGKELLAENIERIGFAYAFDNNGDGQLDTSGGNVIWAIDSDNDNDLDLDLDTNGDGVIDASDDTNTNGLIDGTPLATDVPLTSIRAVKIWLLARTDRTIRGYTDTNIYVVGDKVVTPSGNARKYRRRLLKTTVKCRNL